MSVIKSFKNRITVCFLITAIILSVSKPVYADEIKQSELEQSLYNVVSLLRGLYEDQYSDIENEIKNLITERNYDYGLSMDSFYSQPNPLVKADTVKYLAAYMSCKKYCKDNSIEPIQIRNIPLIKYSIIEHRYEENIPVKVDHYQKYSDSDLFFKHGYDYISYPKEIPVYKVIGEGRYKLTGEKEKIIPETQEKTWIEVNLKAAEPEEIIKRFGIAQKEVSDDFSRRVAELKNITTNDSINQTVSLLLPAALGGTDYSQYLQGIGGNRNHVLKTALSLVGRVPYEWGGKAEKTGYDTSWWTYDNETKLQKGLDCSGFVQWTFMTCGYPHSLCQLLTSTGSILNSGLSEISEEGLLPGDIGCTDRPDGQINHTGIYLGNGNWIHCSSEKATVTVSSFSFDHFYSIADNDNVDEEIYSEYESGFYRGLDRELGLSVDTDNLIDYTHKYTENDIMLLSKAVYNEARGEGLNGWIAVAEVILNRVESEEFPDTVEEVLYSAGQFSNVENLEYIDPPAEIITIAKMVANGSLKVLDNENCMYFRNYRMSADYDGNDTADWGEKKFYVTIGNHTFYTSSHNNKQEENDG